MSNCKRSLKAIAAFAIIMANGVDAQNRTLPDSFPAALQKVIQAANDDFQGARGVPIVSNNETNFYWQTTLTLPGATCRLEQFVVKGQDPKFGQPMQCSCFLPTERDPRILDPVFQQVVAAARAALGPGWDQESRPTSPLMGELAFGPVFFMIKASFTIHPMIQITGRMPEATKIKGGVAATVQKRLDASSLGVTVSVSAPQFKPASQAAAPQSGSDSEGASTAISRILGSNHSKLPDPERSSAPASGSPVVVMNIENRTSYSILLYFRGPASRSLSVLAGASIDVSLPPGRYQVAAEIPGSPLAPFYGEQVYELNSRYELRFYIGSR